MSTESLPEYTVTTIMVKPHTLTYYRYFVNYNLIVPRVGNFDKVYSFLCEHIPSELTMKVHGLLSSKVPFIVDAVKGEIIELRFDYERRLEELRVDLLTQQKIRMEFEGKVKATEQENKKGAFFKEKGEAIVNQCAYMDLMTLTPKKVIR